MKCEHPRSQPLSFLSRLIFGYPGPAQRHLEVTLRHPSFSMGNATNNHEEGRRTTGLIAADDLQLFSISNFWRRCELTRESGNLWSCSKDVVAPYFAFPTV